MVIHIFCHYSDDDRDWDYDDDIKDDDDVFVDIWSTRRSQGKDKTRRDKGPSVFD